MAALKLADILLLTAILLLASPVFSDDEEDDLLKGLNTHRAYFDLPTLLENKGASCVAKEVAKLLKDQPCNESAYTKFQLKTDNHLLSKCHINVTHTKHSVILPVCVPDLDPIQVFTNYTKTDFEKYVKNMHYEQVGVRSHSDWMVVVLGTSTADGDFATSAAVGLGSVVGFGSCLVSLFMGAFMVFLL